MTSATLRKSYGNRKIFTFPEDYTTLRSPKQRPVNVPKKNEEIAKFFKYIDENIVGKTTAFVGPFGRRKGQGLCAKKYKGRIPDKPEEELIVEKTSIAPFPPQNQCLRYKVPLAVYCDYAASGRSLQFIEEYILREVLPTYGNTHSVTSVTSLQTTNYRQEARDIIKTAVNATENDAVLFTGHGCSDALQKLVNALDLREPPIVFTGSSEHHDNLHLWQEVGAKLVRIGETKEGLLDLVDLESQLRFHQNGGRQMIGCFSAASNVTGIVIDDVACTILLHQYQAWAFWDFNIAAPYTQIDMNPSVPGVEENSANKDAVYFSGHKFIGGVQTPGILIVKKSIYRRLHSCDTDGFFTSHEYNKSFEIEEEGSCAAVVESIRAGLVMQLKENVTVSNILQRQEKINKQMLQHIRTIPELILLGNTSPHLRRLPVFSFMVRHPRGTFLHHNFVCAVLNDVFGIQARSGCPCSGAYAQDLLGIDPSLADQYESIILEDRRLSSLNLGVNNSSLELLRPGFTRISLPYFISDAELAFVMEAVKMVATEGWKLLPQYVVDLESGEWRHHTNAMSKDRKFLSAFRYSDGRMNSQCERRISGTGLFPQNYPDCLQTARNLFNRARKTANRSPYADQGISFDSRSEKLRWFMLQNEAQSILTSNAQNIKSKVPFDPVSYSGSQRKSERSFTPSSPRHYSLPSIDDPKLLTCSSPVPYFLQDVNGLYYPQPTLNFALGESVNNFSRERCLSLGAPNISPPVLSPQTRMSLGMSPQYRQRNFSYSSQNESHSLDSDANLSPTHSLNLLYSGRISPAPDIQTYVTEMTKELATNIKSEIREVISRVEDAIENTDVDMCSRSHADRSGSEDGRSDSIAEYIEKVSIEMANEVKSEIRDVVSAVDVFITPDNQDRNYSRTSSSGDEKKAQHTPGSSSETVINLIAKSTSDEEPCEKQHPNKILQSTVASVSSQDSGINLSFQDQDFLQQDPNELKSAGKPQKYIRTVSDGVALESTKHASTPKTIWQPTVEAIQEYDMIQNGDKVLVCLSGGRDSLGLLHTLLQFQSYSQKKGILFSVGAVTVDTYNSDLCCLISHLRNLGVHYIIDDKKIDYDSDGENYSSFSTKNTRARLYATAIEANYNVLALGQHFDDLCESFFLSVFHTGRLRTMRAHYYIKDHQLRVIRPYIYVRDKYLRQFVSSQNLPVVANISGPDLSKERQRIKQVLTQQEILFPKLFTSLRSALHPLIGFQTKGTDSKLRRRKLSKGNADWSETDEEPVMNR